MAVTKLLRIKEGKGSRQNRPLLDALKYICNPEKTKDLYIGGNAGWSAESAFHQMVENKKVWRKPDGTQAFHYILSFPPTEYITPETAMKVTEDFCRELLGDDDFLYLYTIHVDRQHLHAHIVFDSVSRVDGRKFHSPKGDWEKRIQPITDRVCKKYGLSTLSYDEERKGKDYGEWRNQKMREKGVRSEKPTWQDLIRDDIDEAIAASSTYEEFLSYLRTLHYDVRDGKYLSLHAEERQRAIRTYRLGEGYGKEEIQNRILERRKQQEQTGSRAGIFRLRKSPGDPGTAFHPGPQVSRRQMEDVSLPAAVLSPILENLQDAFPLPEAAIHSAQGDREAGRVFRESPLPDRPRYPDAGAGGRI